MPHRHDIASAARAYVTAVEAGDVAALPGAYRRLRVAVGRATMTEKKTWQTRPPTTFVGTYDRPDCATWSGVVGRFIRHEYHGHAPMMAMVTDVRSVRKVDGWRVTATLRPGRMTYISGRPVYESCDMFDGLEPVIDNEPA